MEQIETYLKNLTGKDEIKAEKAAFYLVNASDKELFKRLAEKTDYLFDFVRNNVNRRIEKAVTAKNFMNIINFFDYYSPYYDDLFADILSKNASQDLTDEMFELLEKGTNSQKTYAAKYFAYIPDTIALEPLSKYAFCDDECLSYNAAEALGEMQDDISFDLALGYLESEDDFERLTAVKYFNAYGRNYPFKEIFNSMKTSKMKENIAGQIPYMASLIELLETEYKEDVLNVILNIVLGLGEILPFCDILQMELQEIIIKFINDNKSISEANGKIAVILLASLSEFTVFNENPEYTFDETKETKNEISEIFKLLSDEKDEFWNLQKKYLIDELANENDFSVTALDLIKEFQISQAKDVLKKMLNSKNEIIICKSAIALKSLNEISQSDIQLVSERITNENIKAVIENL